MFAVFISKVADTAVVWFFLCFLAGFFIPVLFVAAGVLFLVALMCSVTDLAIPERYAPPPPPPPPEDGPLNPRMYHSDRR
jgi:hypothetical protein